TDASPGNEAPHDQGRREEPERGRRSAQRRLEEAAEPASAPAQKPGFREYLSIREVAMGRAGEGKRPAREEAGRRTRGDEVAAGGSLAGVPGDDSPRQAPEYRPREEERVFGAGAADRGERTGSNIRRPSGNLLPGRASADDSQVDRRGAALDQLPACDLVAGSEAGSVQDLC